jgi:hypothetical protein
LTGDTPIDTLVFGALGVQVILQNVQHDLAPSEAKRAANDFLSQPVSEKKAKNIVNH